MHASLRAPWDRTQPPITAAFDTLRLARNLREKAKLTPEQAEGFADATAEALRPDIASKADISALRSELRSDLRETELRLVAKIEAVKSELFRWLFGIVGFQSLVILGTVLALVRSGTR